MIIDVYHLNIRNALYYSKPDMRIGMVLYLALLAMIPMIPMALWARGQGRNEAAPPNPYAAELEALGINPLSATEPLESKPFLLLDGRSVSFSEWRGSVAVVNFWATWCIPCREELPGLQRLYETLSPEGLELIAINIQERPELVENFLRNLSVSLPIGYDATGDASLSIGVRGLPVTYLVDKRGYPLGIKIGIIEWDAPEVIESVASDHRRNMNTPGFGLAFIAGIVSFLSPCVLPLIPSYLSFIGGTGLRDLQTSARQRRTVALRSIWFVIGFSILFTALGIVFSGIGALIDIRIVSTVAGVVIIVLGLNIIFDFWSILNIERRLHMKRRPSGYLGAMVAGMAFGAGWAPCIGPILTAILFLAGQSGGSLRGALLLIIYSMGLGVPFIAAGLFFPFFEGFSKRIKTHLKGIRIFSGLLLVAIGLLIMFNRLRVLNSLLIDLGFRLGRFRLESAGAARTIAVLLLLLCGGGAAIIVFARRRTGRNDESPYRSIGGRVVRISAGVLSIAFILLAALQLGGVIDIFAPIAMWLQFQGI